MQHSLASKEQEISDLKQYRTMIESDLDQNKDQVNQLQAQVKDLEKVVEGLESKLAEQKSTQLTEYQKLLEAQGELTLLRSQLENLQGKDREALQLSSENKVLSDRITDLETLHKAQTALLSSEKQQEVQKLSD